MNKYEVFLADNYKSSKPFMTEWDYELIGDKLRAEFDEYFAREEERADAGIGKSKQLLKGEYVKKFMISKRVNLIDDPSNGNLKSVFILKKGEKKVIDERAKDSLAPRFEYRTRKNDEGMTVLIDGFMKFKLVEGEEKKGIDAEEDVQVSGNDVQYFNEETEGETKEESKVEPKEEEKEVFACEVCGKEFDSKRAVNAHSLSHRKK
jgi:hypothetical protein